MTKHAKLIDELEAKVFKKVTRYVTVLNDTDGTVKVHDCTGAVNSMEDIRPWDHVVTINFVDGSEREDDL